MIKAAASFFVRRIPEGFEDETGFHFTASVPAVQFKQRSHGRRVRPSGFRAWAARFFLLNERGHRLGRLLAVSHREWGFK